MEMPRAKRHLKATLKARDNGQREQEKGVQWRVPTTHGGACLIERDSGQKELEIGIVN
ncbi:hypothetical protein [Ammoniphilus resinae]|uniref:Uncharacterized protein n=1 Tax=Ammoniphilus resinae TaxID=861532 RepID=A0ABS4GUP4_9BACL|nr:hypothetical protein [Ammoniphilus resinae]MBP1933983.1 hypothetical protein [Ammoniphilus resinae]